MSSSVSAKCHFAILDNTTHTEISATHNKRTALNISAFNGNLQFGTHLKYSNICHPCMICLKIPIIYLEDLDFSLCVSLLCHFCLFCLLILISYSEIADSRHSLCHFSSRPWFPPPHPSTALHLHSPSPSSSSPTSFHFSLFFFSISI